jgi:energy-coupling factor transport system permease protein
MACTGLSFAALLLFDDPVFLLGPALGLLLVAALGRVTGKFLAGALVLGSFGMLTFLIWPLFLTLRGQGGVDAWIYGAGVGLRLIEILLAAFLLMLTTSNEQLLAGLGRMGLPYPMVFALGLTSRLLPSLLATAGHVVEAQRLRGLRFDEGGLVKRARRYIPLLVPILACSLRTVHQMSWALEAKGFGVDGGGKRVPFIELRMRLRDWIVLALALALLAGAVWLRMRGIGILGMMHAA